MSASPAKEPKERIPVAIGIDRADRARLAELLSLALSNTYVLYAKIQGFHWNVRGPLFYSIHKMTEEQYEDLGAAIDEVAERIRAIGFLSPNTLKKFLATAEVKEAEGESEASEMLDSLVQDHQTVARSLRHAVDEATRVDDVFTADMLTARIGKHEEFAWMLRALAGKH
jgi:starvation-inducible DNA-binding protein